MAAVFVVGKTKEEKHLNSYWWSIRLMWYTHIVKYHTSTEKPVLEYLNDMKNVIKRISSESEYTICPEIYRNKPGILYLQNGITNYFCLGNV